MYCYVVLQTTKSTKTWPKPMEMELVVADNNDSGGGNGYDDYNSIDIAISNAGVTPNVATKCGPVL